MEQLINQFLYGYGYGSGYGDGYGDGDGSGSGSGDGYGYGYGSGAQLKFNTYKGQRVYYIDRIPCYFTHMNKDALFAKVMVIDTQDLSVSPMFVCRFNGCFAHGVTLKEARRDSQNKFYSQMDVEGRIRAFNDTFKPKLEYDSSLFYEWHTTLTGSCQAGKELFVKQNGIDLSGKMTRELFISLTKGAYGGEIISRLIES